MFIVSYPDKSFKIDIFVNSKNQLALGFNPIYERTKIHQQIFHKI